MRPLGGHDVFPFELTRPFSKVINVDTVTIMDPNFPQEDIHLVVDYSGQRMDAYDLGGSHLYWVVTASLSGSLGEIDMSKFAQIKPKKPGVVKQYHAKTNLHPGTIYTSEVCDYKIENLDKPSEIIEVKDDKFTNGFSTVFAQYILNSDHLPDVLTSTQSLNIKTSLTRCTDRHSWHYAHKDGSLIYMRTGVKPTDVDIVYNNGKTMRILNNNNSLENVTVTSIMDSDDEEAVVTLTDFKLEDGKELNIEVVDMYRVVVKNDVTDSASYTLNVRYLGKTEDFEWVTHSIKINSDDTHVILLRPTDEDKEVRILVDTTGDGNADDTLLIENNSNIDDILVERCNLQLFPNPASDMISLHMTNLNTTESTFRLVDINGKIVFEKSMNHGFSIAKQYDVSQLARGIYTAEIVTNEGKSTIRKKLVLH
jgi:hypothetical protein